MKRGIIFVNLLVFLLSLAGCGNEAASFGVIGGADGPTAIFVTSGTDWLSILAVIVVAILVVVLIYRNKKK